MAIWFGCNWSIRAKNLNIASNEDILKVVLNPPPPLNLIPLMQWVAKLDELSTLQMTLTIEAIWHFRNQVLHNDSEVNINSTICNA